MLIKKLIEYAHATAESIIKKHTDALKKIATTLIEKETLEQDEFYGLLKPFKREPFAVV